MPRTILSAGFSSVGVRFTSSFGEAIASHFVRDSSEPYPRVNQYRDEEANFKVDIAPLALTSGSDCPQLLSLAAHPAPASAPSFNKYKYVGGSNKEEDILWWGDLQTPLQRVSGTEAPLVDSAVHYKGVQYSGSGPVSDAEVHEDRDIIFVSVSNSTAEVFAARVDQPGQTSVLLVSLNGAEGTFTANGEGSSPILYRDFTQVEQSRADLRAGLSYTPQYIRIFQSFKVLGAAVDRRARRVTLLLDLAYQKLATDSVENLNYEYYNEHDQAVVTFSLSSQWGVLSYSVNTFLETGLKRRYSISGNRVTDKVGSGDYYSLQQTILDEFLGDYKVDIHYEGGTIKYTHIKNVTGTPVTYTGDDTVTTVGYGDYSYSTVTHTADNSAQGEAGWGVYVDNTFVGYVGEYVKRSWTFTSSALRRIGGSEIDWVSGSYNFSHPGDQRGRDPSYYDQLMLHPMTYQAPYVDSYNKHSISMLVAESGWCDPDYQIVEDEPGVFEENIVGRPVIHTLVYLGGTKAVDVYEKVTDAIVKGVNPDVQEWARPQYESLWIDVPGRAAGIGEGEDDALFIRFTLAPGVRYSILSGVSSAPPGVPGAPEDGWYQNTTGYSTREYQSVEEVFSYSPEVAGICKMGAKFPGNVNLFCAWHKTGPRTLTYTNSAATDNFNVWTKCFFVKEGGVSITQGYDTLKALVDNQVFSSWLSDYADVQLVNNVSFDSF